MKLHGSWRSWGVTAFVVGITLQTLIGAVLDKVFGISVSAGPIVALGIPVCCMVIGIVAGHRYDRYEDRVRFKYGDDRVKILAVIELTVLLLIWGLCILLLIMSVRWFR